MIGTLLDQRYQVVQVLSQGGFGHTYIAQDTRRPGNPTCVVKHLKPATSDPDFLQTARRLFNSEAETLEKLGAHDQIPRLLAYFEENEEFYLVQEFIAGHPLGTELSPGQRWSENQVIQLISEVLSILEFVHSNGVIHRDIKPDNLIRRLADNKIVLVDFGAVKQVQMQSLIAQEPINETVAIGTPGYMPTEQGQGRPRPSSDIYALGMIGIQALTGLNPRQLSEDSETGEIVWQHQAQVNSGLATVLSNMVRHYFKHRYQSATEALRALTSLTNPTTPQALVAALSQRVRCYLRDSYQSVTRSVRTLQYQAATTALRTKSYIPPDETTSLLPTPPSGTPTPPPISSEQNTVTVAPANPHNMSVSSQHSPASVSQSPLKLPLLIGVGTATVVIAVSAISWNRQSPTSPAITQNSTENKAETKTEVTPSKPEPEPKKGCAVVVNSSNVRSLSGRKRTGQVVKAGTKVTTTGKVEEGWLEISAPVSGWIWKSRTKNTCSPS